MNDRERDTILAALRLWQRTHPHPDDLMTIADEHAARLTADEIDELCDRINRDDQPLVVLHLDGGLIDDINATTPLEVIILDYDAEPGDDRYPGRLNHDGFSALPSVRLVSGDDGDIAEAIKARLPDPPTTNTDTRPGE